MEKYTYYVIVLKKGEQRITSAFRLHNCYNLASILQGLTTDPYGNKRCEVEWLNACDTRAKAVAIANDWNNSWETKGIFWEDGPRPYTWIY